MSKDDFFNNNGEDFSIKQFFKEVADSVRQTVGAVRQEFRKTIDMSPAARKVALKFHRATMTDSQFAAYQAIKKTKSVYVDKNRSVPAYTVSAALRAEDAEKAVRVLELEQEGDHGVLVKWACVGAKEAPAKMRRKWF